MALAGMVACLLLTSCRQARPIPTPLPSPSPTFTPTPQQGFAVSVTSLTPSPAPLPTATPFRPPKMPWLQLIPNQGPPVSKTILVRGGRLPPSSPARLVWTQGHEQTSITALASTTPRGGLSARFPAPAAPPGTYRVLLEIGGAVWVSARYRVHSSANLSVQIRPASQGTDLRLHGDHFVPGIRLQLIVTPLAAHRKPFLLGTVHASSDGSFRFETRSRKLLPGQYVVQAVSITAVSAQMAETFFQVEL